MPCIKLLIKGKVQGVFYRVTARKVAVENNISGWVKNTGEGHVEIAACGYQDALDTFTEWCRQGPNAAVVTSVEISLSEGDSFEGFKIRKD